MTINLPNQITIARLLLAVIFFVMMSFTKAESFDAQRGLLAGCFWVFLVAALSDVLDGILARTMGQVTSFGRIVDPVVDKVLVCGAFLFLASHHFHDSGRKLNLSAVEPWMVVLILAREMLVSGIRSHSESAGKAYPADWLGKLKMFVQCATVCIVIGGQAWHADNAGFQYFAKLCVWTMVVVTALSIVTYLQRGREFIFSRAALSNSPPRAAGRAAPEQNARSRASAAAAQPTGASA